MKRTIPGRGSVLSSLKVGDVAERSGIAVSTVHFYESKGLIESWRSEGNQRRYSRDVLRRIAVIRIAQRAGISLSTIKPYLDAIPTGRPISKSDWHKLTLAWKSMLEDRIASLLQLRDQMETCIGCGCLSLTECRLRNPDDMLAQMGPGPQLLQPSVPGSGEDEPPTKA